MRTSYGNGVPARAAARVVERLILEENELAGDLEVLSDVQRQVEAIARVVLESEGRAVVSSHRSAEQDARLGMRRAAADIHPSASLRAATICFEEIYPLLLPPDPVCDTGQAVELAVLLQEVVGGVVLSAATGYVDQLLARLHTVHLQERRRVAAQLHDSTAQFIASAIQRLQYEDVPGAEVRAILQNALQEVRGVALDLRQSVGSRRIDEALAAYLGDRQDESVRIELTQVGSPRSFGEMLQEEVFLIVRELLLNALKHSGAEAVDIAFAWGADQVEVSVVDNGKGFNPSHSRASRMGLLICRERAESIGASLDIVTALGRGTRATLSVPL